MHALDRRCRHDGQAGPRELGLGDVCDMGLIEGLNQLDAIAQGAAEEHSETDGAAGRASYLGSNGDIPSQGDLAGESPSVAAVRSGDG